ncbi:MAG: extracellular solute-binding protein [Burkholderiaceae bacterium]|nr:extracellular solute-binding protein [Burkholderiaceae bacterium]
MIDAAKLEGSVTIYSAQGLKQLNALAEKFTETYGIKVEVVRAIDADLIPKVTVEFETGRGIADVVVNSSLLAIADQEAKGYFVPVIGPAFDNPDYKREERMPRGVSFESNATILTYSWNTELVPDGIKDYDDIFRPELEGLIAIPRASVSTIVDFYFYLHENYGEDFTDRLAAMKPRIYPSALTAAQALSSGEVAVILFGEPQIDEKAIGAPVETGFAPSIWGARFYVNTMKVAPHPNAAQLLANFMVTPAGQEAIARKAASALPNIPGAVANMDDVRRPDPAKLTAEAVTAFQEKFTALFGSN